MAHYTELATDKSAQEIGYITRLPEVDAVILYSFGRILLEQAQKDSRFGRVRAGLYIALNEINAGRYSLSQISIAIPKQNDAFVVMLNE